MDLRDFVTESIESNRQATLDIVKDLTPAQLQWRPSPEANYIAFLLFHIFRGADRYFHRVTGRTELWDEDGWSDRWQLSSKDPSQSTTGFNWTAKQVATWEPPPLQELLAYGETVRSSFVSAIRDLDLGRLSEIPAPDLPDRTIARYLQLASLHKAEHRGQIDYILGLMKATQD